MRKKCMPAPHKYYRLQGDKGSWHWYWGFVNGVEQVMGRPADREHPANNKWEVSMKPPEGYDHFDYLLESETAGG